MFQRVQRDRMRLILSTTSTCSALRYPKSQPKLTDADGFATHVLQLGPKETQFDK